MESAEHRPGTKNTLVSLTLQSSPVCDWLGKVWLLPCHCEDLIPASESCPWFITLSPECVLSHSSEAADLHPNLHTWKRDE